MGNLDITEDKGIKLVTLNFSSLIQNPFEFYDEQSFQQTEQMDKILKDILKRELRLSDIQVKNYAWDVGEIDKNFLKGRCAVQFDPEACFIRVQNSDGTEGFRLMTTKEFKTEWKKRFDQAKERFIKKVPSEAQQLNCMVMDFIYYSTLVEGRLGKRVDEAVKLPFERINEFRDYLHKKHKAQYLMPEVKQKRMVDFIKTNSIDVIFLQQVSRGLKVADWIMGETRLDDYEVVINEDNKDMVIIYRKSKLDYKRDFEFENNQKLNIKVVKDIGFCKIGEFLLISAHFTSKKQQIVQSNNFLRMIAYIRSKYPKIYVVSGVNSNLFLQQITLSIYPDSNELFTSLKKRTLIQAQFNKANLVIKQVKDHLVSSQKLFDCRIMKINKEEITETSFEPSQKHPFPNFIVFGRIDP